MFLSKHYQVLLTIFSLSLHTWRVYRSYHRIRHQVKANDLSKCKCHRAACVLPWKHWGVMRVCGGFELLHPCERHFRWKQKHIVVDAESGLRRLLFVFALSHLSCALHPRHQQIANIMRFMNIWWHVRGGTSSFPTHSFVFVHGFICSRTPLRMVWPMRAKFPNQFYNFNQCLLGLYLERRPCSASIFVEMRVE